MRPRPAARVTPPPAATPSPSLENLAACVDDARAAALDPASGPPDPTQFRPLRTRLEAARKKLPPLYARAVGDPFVATLDRLGARGFARVLAEDPDREGAARLVLDVAQAILQNGEGYEAQATDGFQEVVSDLYDGFLSAEDRRGVKRPDRGVVPPLVKWGDAEAGPYTWPVTATASVEVQAPIVSLPAANARRGLLAWAALGHETAGHDVLDADDGLRDELARTLRDRIVAAKLDPAIADYFADRIDETASDVLGILNMGPAAAAGLVGYFRALNGAWGDRPVLRSDGPEDDPHPADVVRAWVGAETVRLLSFAGAKAWADLVSAEADHDAARTVRLGAVAMTPGVARDVAAVVARTIVREKVDALERHALGDVQDWRDRDEEIVASLRAELRAPRPPPTRWGKGIYAAHAVAAAVTEALAGGDPKALTPRMIVVLKAMHDANPAWGPLYVAHRGDLVAWRARRVA